ncbi:MAG TPA: DUF1702 family protein [Herpetosiphonaceae bacterium]
MGAIGSSMRTIVFGISPREVTCLRRGFQPKTSMVCARLEQIGTTFLAGYHTVLRDPRVIEVERQLNRIDLEVRGFAFEGAAMAFTLLDVLMPQRSSRFLQFVQGPAADHVYMSYVGAGWAHARLHRRFDRLRSAGDPLLGWLAVDGYGFHEGYFHGRRYLTTQHWPRRLAGYERRVFDQGFGRSLWFVKAMDVEVIAQTIAAFAPGRHSDLWSGVGLACAYAGGVDQSTLIALRDAAGPCVPQVAQGVAFAAKTRKRAGHLPEHTESAARILCGMSAHQAAAITDQSLKDLAAERDTPAYEIWRQRIQSCFGGAIAYER